MKAIKGFEGRYEITEEGKIWSHPNRRNSFKGMWLNAYVSKKISGRATPRHCLFVSLFDETGKRFTRQVHRLVAEAYIPNPENKPIVNHKDGNPLNPHINNLEWVTNKENSDHAFRIGLITKPLTEGEVAEIKKLTGFFSCRSIALAYKMHPSTVWDIAHGHRYQECREAV